MDRGRFPGRDRHKREQLPGARAFRWWLIDILGDHGWTEAEFRSTWQEANRLGRADVPFAWLWQLLGRVSSAKRRVERRRMAGIAHLDRRGINRATLRKPNPHD